MSAGAGTNRALLETCQQFAATYLDGEAARLNEAEPADPVVHVSWRDLQRYDPNLAEDMLAQPDTVKSHLRAGFAATASLPNASITESDLRDAEVRLTEMPEHLTVDIGDFRPSEVVDRIRGLRGQISRVTIPELLATQLAYECQRCGYITEIPQHDAEQQEPNECTGCERQGPFLINRQGSSFEDYQRVRLETPPEKRGRGGAEEVDLTLRGDLVREVRPGERVTMATSVDIEETDDDRPTFAVTGEAESVTHEEDDLDAVAVDEHREAINELAARDDTAEAILHSIAPSIYGHEEVKEAIALQLFGGVHRELADGSSRRGTINLLLIGDPGTGKSILLSHAADLSPRSIYTSGNGTTGVGLTAAAVQDDFGGGGWTIEAGALVQAHKGVCCIDELDDMREEDRGGMLEAMSQQTVSKTAAGQNVTLPARTTVLAAANPVHGRWDDHQPVADQVDLDPALLSRFDLMFTFRDKRDQERDNKLAARMTAPARDGGSDDIEPEIPKPVLRAYIAHARQRYDPNLTPDADEELRKRFIDIRQANDDDGPVPTTPRLLSSMQRLAEASARMRLSDTVTVDDVNRAADIAVSCLKDVGVDPESGEFDVDVIESGRSKAQRERVQTITALLEEMDDPTGPGVDREALLDRAEAAGIERSQAEHRIQKMRDNGQVYSPSDGHLRSV